MTMPKFQVRFDTQVRFWRYANIEAENIEAAREQLARAQKRGPGLDWEHADLIGGFDWENSEEGETTAEVTREAREGELNDPLIAVTSDGDLERGPIWTLRTSCGEGYIEVNGEGYAISDPPEEYADVIRWEVEKIDPRCQGTVMPYNVDILCVGGYRLPEKNATGPNRRFPAECTGEGLDGSVDPEWRPCGFEHGEGAQ